MKAVILAGGPGTSGFPLNIQYPLLACPIINTPLLAHLLEWLINYDIYEVAIVLHKNLQDVERLRAQCLGYENLHVVVVSDHEGRGTAGSLHYVKDFLGSSDFLVMNGSTFVDRLNIKHVHAFHCHQQNGITILAQAQEMSSPVLENIIIEDDGSVIEIRHLHRSRDRRQTLRTCGIYLLSPHVLAYIPEQGYFDLKEQLVPSARKHGIPIRVYPTDAARPIRHVHDYLHINWQLLEQGRHVLSRSHYATQTPDFISISPDAHISPQAFITGPVSIGPNCTIEDHVRIIGPAVIGPNAYLEKGSVVRESILWAGARLKSHAYVQRSVIAEYARLDEHQRVTDAVVLDHDNMAYPLASFAPSFPHQSFLHTNHVARTTKTRINPSLFRTMQGLAYHIGKRTMDFLGASLGLLGLSPLFLIIAVAIKSDSAGPIFYGQRRCGKGGHEFIMYKFRTMLPEADSLKQTLMEQNAVDGPMFKLENDPRVTRVGKFLRRTSLDELPQLWNVLKGEMSLVGPRPLAYEEMKFCPPWRDLRLSIKPGMTGSWQVHARDRHKFSEWIHYDIDYVMHQSLWLDLRILYQTIKMLTKRKSDDNA